MNSHRRPPISARHAFALAFDLAVRRDTLHSMVVPLVLWAPWTLAPALAPLAFPGMHTSQLLLVQAASNLFTFVAFVIVTSMLRFRAASVFHAGGHADPAPIGECYRLGLSRAPVLYLTEALRNIAFGISFSMLFVPFLYLGFKLSLATEAVVLRRENPVQAFSRSYHLTDGRFERWLEMIAMSVLLVVPVWFLCVVGFLLVPGSSWNTWLSVGSFLSAALMPIVQYAWSFFYLRLDELDQAEAEANAAVPAPTFAPVRRAAAGGAQPKLRLVESPKRDLDEPSAE